jgi:4a-hydroxytetrahydrobiopterin dehydratase
MFAMPSKNPLTDAELKSFLSTHDKWSFGADGLSRTFEARSFLDGIEFVAAVAKLAERANHHPDIDIRWRKVTLRLITHDAGNRITALDTLLAAQADQAFQSFSS